MPDIPLLTAFLPRLARPDWFALVLFVTVVVGYRLFLARMLKHQPHNLFLGKLQEYRAAWIATHTGGENSIAVVQTMRNTIMSASFLASTSVLLIMGALNLLELPEAGVQGLTPRALKLLLVVFLLAYSFFNFTWHIREINYMSFILNIPKAELDKIEGDDSTRRLAHMFLTSGIHFSLGIRGFYFLVPLLMWFFSPLLMVLSTLAILVILMRRDLTGE